MARQRLPDVKPRTIRVHVPTYDAILTFFAASPSGLRGSDAIRQVLYAFGIYCREQVRKGRTANSSDLRKAEQIVMEMLGTKAEAIPPLEDTQEIQHDRHN
jgi:hypothetical protein